LGALLVFLTELSGQKVEQLFDDFHPHSKLVIAPLDGNTHCALRT
jgi:hypothetical protein